MAFISICNKKYILLIAFLCIFLNSKKTIYGMTEGEEENEEPQRRTQTELALEHVRNTGQNYISSAGLVYLMPQNSNMTHAVRHVLEHVWNDDQNIPLLPPEPESRRVISSYVQGLVDPIQFIDILYTRISPLIGNVTLSVTDSYSEPIGQITLHDLTYNVRYMHLPQGGAIAKYKFRIEPAERDRRRYPSAGFDNNPQRRGHRLYCYVLIIDFNYVFDTNTRLATPSGAPPSVLTFFAQN